MGRFYDQAIRARAEHHTYRTQFANAAKVMARFPIYSVRGAARHHILNGDVFDDGSREVRGDEEASAVEAKRLQREMMAEGIG